MTDNTHPDPARPTVVWGELEKCRFLKVPKTFAFLGRYDARVGREVRPRHLLLIIALACRKYRDHPIRAYWQDIASGIGVPVSTVRRWAYELRKLGLLDITHTKREDGTNGANEFDLAPFVELLEKADAKWQHWRRESEPLS